MRVRANSKHSPAAHCEFACGRSGLLCNGGGSETHHGLAMHGEEQPRCAPLGVHLPTYVWGYVGSSEIGVAVESGESAVGSIPAWVQCTPRGEPSSVAASRALPPSIPSAAFSIVDFAFFLIRLPSVLSPFLRRRFLRLPTTSSLLLPSPLITSSLAHRMRILLFVFVRSGRFSPFVEVRQSNELREDGRTSCKVHGGMKENARERVFRVGEEKMACENGHGAEEIRIECTPVSLETGGRRHLFCFSAGENLRQSSRLRITRIS